MPRFPLVLAGELHDRALQAIGERLLLIGYTGPLVNQCAAKRGGAVATVTPWWLFSDFRHQLAPCLS